MTSLQERYKLAAKADTDIGEHLALMYLAAIGVHAQRIIELGVRSGESTLAWLAAVEKTDGHLWSIDMIDPTPSEPLPDHRWTFVHGNDLDPDVAAQVPTNDVDILFIDTSHAYAHTLAELQLYASRVRKGGLVFLHDTEVRVPDSLIGEPEYPVKKAIAEYCDARGYGWRNLTYCNGMAEIVVV